MQFQTQKAKLGSEPAADKPAQFPLCNIVDLPIELLLRVISFLPIGSIRNLMVNRSLRLVCEQALYRTISLPIHPQRSIRLLETFLLRPELALLVQHLEIDCSFDQRFHTAMALVSRLGGEGALAQAQNIRSLSIRGVWDWLWEPDRHDLRTTIFKMRLVRLELFFHDEPHIVHDHDHGDISDGGVGAKIRALLQAQPFLEDFKLSERVLTTTSAASLQGCGLQASDVPSLKSLQATPEIALAFLPVAPRLESLNLMITMWSEFLLSSIATKAAVIKLSIRRFTFSAWDCDRWFWDNLEHVFALFPNIEYLSVAINIFTWILTVEPGNFYFGVIANHIHYFPYLREIEVGYETLGVELPDILKVETQTVLTFKRACPLLETVVDPERRLWMFRPQRESPTEFIPLLIGPLMIAEHTWYMEDLPTRENNS